MNARNKRSAGMLGRIHAYQNAATNTTASNATKEESRNVPVRGASTRYGTTALARQKRGPQRLASQPVKCLPHSPNPGIR